MKHFMAIRLVLIGIISAIFLIACSDEENEDQAKVQSEKVVEKTAPAKDQAIENDGSVGQQDNKVAKPIPAFNLDLPPLPIEKTGNVVVLPETIPETWMYVDEANFFNMLSGKVILLDVAEENKNQRIKGLVDKSLLGNFKVAKTRPEFYVMETFHERGVRGRRTDVLTIYDKTTLAPFKELVWKDALRLYALPERYAMALSADERFLFVANFSPGTSFTVVDLESKEIVETIGTPGCVLTYPTGKNSVTSICSNGGLLTTVIDENGHKKSQHRINPFFDTDKTPVFERPVIIDGIAYFSSFEGMIHAFDFNGEVAKYIESWSMLSEQERKGNWRPGGLVLNDSDEQGLYYSIMQPDGHDGTQTQGGPQVWVFDMAKKQKLLTIDVPNWAVSMAVTRGKEPLVVVTNGELNLDIFNAKDGKFIQTISDFGNVTPLAVHKAY